MHLQIIFYSESNQIGLLAQYASFLSKLPLGNKLRCQLQGVSIECQCHQALWSFPVTRRHCFTQMCPLRWVVSRETGFPLHLRCHGEWNGNKTVLCPARGTLTASVDGLGPHCICSGMLNLEQISQSPQNIFSNQKCQSFWWHMKECLC